jgi:ribonuclease VapC
MQVLRAATSCYIAWPTLLEAWTVLASRLNAEKADAHIADFRAYMMAVAFDEDHYGAARDAYERFRLNGHPARLNCGDTMSYALARAMALPLLFKGVHFGMTDVKVHPASVLS